MDSGTENIKLPELLYSGVFASAKDVNFHSHPGTELVLLTGGWCEMEVDGRMLEGGTGKLFILPGRKPHSQLNKGFVRTIYLSFLWNGFFNETPRVLDISDNRWIKLWMKHIFRMHRSMTHESVMQGILYSLLSTVKLLEKDSEREVMHPALRKALEYIDIHVDRTVSLGDMAEYSGISPSYLSALFYKRFNKSPVSAALDKKMKYAGQLLKEPYYSVKETAVACGFNDPNYFCRFFRKYHGCSPGEYRRTHQDD